MLINHDAYPYGAYLGSYIKTPTVFKCPADRSTALIYGTKYPRVRSLSMNNFVGNPSRANTAVPYPITSPSQGNSLYPPYGTISSIRSPTLTFVVLDEHPDSINDGVFSTDVDDPSQLRDVPGSSHGGAGGFSFADGHSEIHKWTAACILQPYNPNPPGGNINNQPMAGDPGIGDLYWLQLHAVGTGHFP
jgi:prepilin-type processing-associated H-X9-DG protein